MKRSVYRAQEEMKVLTPIKGFQGYHRFLSNFWPVAMIVDGILYMSVEHAYQAHKTLDKDIRRKVGRCQTPGDAKRFGKTIEPHPAWNDEYKLMIMETLLTQLDEIESKKDPNIYRLSHYLTAASDIIDETKAGVIPSDAFSRAFNPTRGMHNIAKLLKLNLTVERGAWVLTKK